MKTCLFFIGFLVVFINTCKHNAQYSKTTSSSSENNSINLPSDIEYFTLLNAISENWTAGIINGGSGIDYYFKIKINTSEKLIFDSAWINNKSFGIYISRVTTSISNEPVKYGNGDIITLRVSDMKNQNSKAVNSNPPKKFDGAALIGLTINGKRDYYIIKEIKKQISPNRP